MNNYQNNVFTEKSAYEQLTTENQSAILGSTQWQKLYELMEQYANKEITGTHNIFSDDKWERDEGENFYENEHNIYWDNQYELQHPFRSFLCKYTAYKAIVINTNSVSTERSKNIYLNNFFKSLNSKHILSGKEGTPLIGVNNITREDIERYIDTRIASSLAPKTIVLYSGAITDLKAASSDFKDNLPILNMGNVLPWELDGISITKWVDRRFKDLGVTPSEVQPYTPFGSTTSMMLVENSMNILDSYAEMAIELFSEGKMFGKTRKGRPRQRFSDHQRCVHATKYEGVFDEILPMEIESYMVKESFYGNLYRLIQGAMINIILFTTGIRNIDLRLLTIGCCNPSDAKDSLFYISTDFKKTGNDISIPVPPQTDRAIKILEKLRFGESEFILARYTINTDAKDPTEKDYINYYKRNMAGDVVNKLIRNFANHFKIPFIDENGEDDVEATAHRYRATTAGWLASASNLSVLMVRRLFGHTNNLMPLSYLHHNEFFISAIDNITESAHNEVAGKLTKAVADGKIGGIKGKQLLNGYRYRRGKSQSASEANILVDIHDELKDRMDNGQLCGFITPLSVICGRNTTDTNATPCAKRSYKDTISIKTNEEILKHLSMVRPDHCIGNACKEAIIGEWSTALRDSFIWYAKLAKGLHGDAFTDEHYYEEGQSFINQYAEDMMTVYGLEFDNVE